MANNLLENSTIEERTAKDKKGILEVLKELPIIQAACKRADVSRASYYRWRSEDPNFLRESDAALATGRAFVTDMSESQLITLIKEKKMPAIALWLKHNDARYGAKLATPASAGAASHMAIDDPHYEALRKVGQDYEAKLRDAIVAQIHET